MKTHNSFSILFSIFLCLSGCVSGRRHAMAGKNFAIPDSLYPAANLVIATHNDWTRGNYPKMIALFKEQPLQMHDIVFLGNSITQQGGDWGKRLHNPAIKNRGIAGDVTDGVLQRLGEITFIKPKAVFIEIGVNDLFNRSLSPERTANNIVKIAEAIRQRSADTRIYVQTIFPTDQGWMIARIRETNERIARSGGKLFRVIDTHSLLTDSSDKMKKEYTTDGVHLTEAGYVVWASCLKNYLK